jgi:hypothetical protein
MGCMACLHHRDGLNPADLSTLLGGFYRESIDLCFESKVSRNLYGPFFFFLK